MKNLTKNLLLIFILFFGFQDYISAQIADGIIYQAEARDNRGNLLKNTQLDVKISVLKDHPSGDIVWEGMHQIISNDYGMFVLVIGEGANTEGFEFQDIQWGLYPHFLNVQVKNGNTERWIDMGTEKFLSVPYALHSKTASQIVYENDNKLKSAKPGVSSQNWSLFGNLKSDPEKDKLGTTDKADLVFVTNNEERLRITKEGKLITPDGVGLELGGNLSVKGDETTIDKDLYVGRNVYLNVNNEFNPHGETFNFGNFSVENMSSTLLTGTLQVNKDALFNEKIVVDNSELGSTSTSTGALIVAGGTGIGENLFVGGETQLEGAVNVTDLTSSVSPTTGALKVAGGVGIDENLNVNGAADFANTFNLAGAANLQSTLNVTGNSTVTKLNANGQVTINAELGSKQSEYNNYPLQVEGSEQGIAIKLTPNKPLRVNNFITFWGGDGAAKGRIEGSDGAGEFFRTAVIDMISIPKLKDALEYSDNENKQPNGKEVSPGDYFNNDYAYGGLSITFDFVNSIIKFGINVIAAAGGACIVGDCDDVVWSAVEMVVNSLQLGGYIGYNEINKGVAFESGGADYAEWLMKNDENEAFTFGDVVGVNGGLISKEFKNSEKYMVISKDPTVIGAMPDEKNRKKYERIAFMGQVPVKVIGKVKKGDYILPSGNNDGMAIAVAPNKMAALDYSRIIGIAWGESNGKKLFDYVNTAVGINSNDMAGIINNMQLLINEMQLAINTVVPDFQPQLYAVNGNSAIPANQYTKSQSLQDLFGNNSDALQYKSLDEALFKAKEYAELQNFDFSQYPYLDEIFENPNPELAEEMINHYSKVLNNLTALMAEYQNGNN